MQRSQAQAAAVAAGSNDEASALDLLSTDGHRPPAREAPQAAAVDRLSSLATAVTIYLAQCFLTDRDVLTGLGGTSRAFFHSLRLAYQLKQWIHVQPLHWHHPARVRGANVPRYARFCLGARTDSFSCKRFFTPAESGWSRRPHSQPLTPHSVGLPQSVHLIGQDHYDYIVSPLDECDAFTVLPSTVTHLRVGTESDECLPSSAPCEMRDWPPLLTSLELLAAPIDWFRFTEEEFADSYDETTAASEAALQSAVDRCWPVLPHLTHLLVRPRHWEEENGARSSEIHFPSFVECIDYEPLESDGWTVTPTG